MFQAIFEADGAYVDFYPNPLGQQRKLAFTFSALDGVGIGRKARGFGVNFLLKNGYDVVAFKAGRALWYQDFADEALDCVLGFVEALGRQYEIRVGYGMSMGATGAIAFSNKLSLDRVIGFSPQFCVTPPWDRRWVPFAEPGFGFSVQLDQINGKADYFIIYDAFDVGDARQVSELRQVISPDRLHTLSIDHTGHMTGFCLQQADELGRVVLSTLNDGAFPDTQTAFRSKRRKSALYLVNLASRFAERNRLRAAIAALDEAIEIYSKEEPGPQNWATDCVGVFLSKSKYLAALDQMNEAVACCEQAITRARTHEPERLPFALNQRASHFARVGDFEAALRIQDEAISLRPSYGPLHGYRANSLLALGRKEEALAAARRQVEIGMTDAAAHYALSHVLSACGRHAEALESLQLAVQYAPEDLTYRTALAHLLRFLGHPDRAAVQLQAIIDKVPTDFASRANLSRAYFDSRRLDDALVQIDDVIARDAGVAAHHSHRSVVCFHLGQNEEAVRSAQDALDRDPDSATLRKALDHMVGATGLAQDTASA